MKIVNNTYFVSKHKIRSTINKNFYNILAKSTKF